jgi:hypothetical protein
LISLAGLGLLITIAFVATAAPAFANLNGVLLTQNKISSVTTGTIDSQTSPQDVHSVYLYAGERVSVNVSSPTLVLRLYGITTQFDFSGVITPISAIVTRTAGAADPLEFEAPTSSTYKLRVTSNSLHEAYSLDTTVTRVATFLRVVPTAASLAFNMPVSIVGWVVNWRTQNPVTDPVSGLVTLSYAGDGSAFLPVLRQPLAPGGSFAFDPAHLTYTKMWWSVVFEGNDAFAPSAGVEAISVYAQLDALTATRTKTRTYRIVGAVRPFQTAGTYPARFYLERKVSGKWKSYGYLNAKASDGPFQGYSILTATKTFPFAGSWRARPYFPGDARTLPTGGSDVSRAVK